MNSMKPFVLTTPFALDLTRERGWQADNSSRKFSIVRFSYYLEPHQLPDEVCAGEIIGHYEGPPDTEQEVSINLEHPFEEIDIDRSASQILAEEEHVTEVMTLITSAFGGEREGALDKNDKKTVHRMLKAATPMATSDHHACTTTKKKRFQARTRNSTDASTPYVAVAAYKQWAYDIYLYQLDYLLVEYNRSPLGLRKKRIKIPHSPEREPHENVISTSVARGTMTFWRPLPQSSWLVASDQYSNDVPYPHRITVTPPLDIRQHPPRISRRDRPPSLYQISNVAFPLRWIDRKGGDWTEEDLREIEWEECEGSAWSFKYGLSRKAKR